MRRGRGRGWLPSPVVRYHLPQQTPPNSCCSSDGLNPPRAVAGPLHKVTTHLGCGVPFRARRANRHARSRGRCPRPQRSGTRSPSLGQVRSGCFSRLSSTNCRFARPPTAGSAPSGTPVPEPRESQSPDSRREARKIKAGTTGKAAEPRRPMDRRQSPQLRDRNSPRRSGPGPGSGEPIAFPYPADSAPGSAQRGKPCERTPCGAAGSRIRFSLSPRTTSDKPTRGCHRPSTRRHCPAVDHDIRCSRR